MEQDREYLEGGEAVCPSCNSGDNIKGGFDFQDGKTQMDCESCASHFWIKNSDYNLSEDYDGSIQWKI